MLFPLIIDAFLGEIACFTTNIFHKFIVREAHSESIITQTIVLVLSTLSFAFNSRRNHKSVKLYFPGRLCGPRLLWHGGPYLPFCPQTPAPGKDCFAERKSREPTDDGAFQFQERMWGQILRPGLRLSHASLRCHASRRNFSLLGQKVLIDWLVPWGHLRIETTKYLTWF